MPKDASSIIPFHALFKLILWMCYYKEINLTFISKDGVYMGRFPTEGGFKLSRFEMYPCKMLKVKPLFLERALD